MRSILTFLLFQHDNQAINEKARQREFDDFIKQSEIVATVKIPEFLPNAPSKPRLEKFSPGKKFSAAKTFLSSGSMFEVPRTMDFTNFFKAD